MSIATFFNILLYRYRSFNGSIFFIYFLKLRLDKYVRIYFVLVLKSLQDLFLDKIDDLEMFWLVCNRSLGGCRDKNKLHFHSNAVLEFLYSFYLIEHRIMLILFLRIQSILRYNGWFELFYNCNFIVNHLEK